MNIYFASHSPLTALAVFILPWEFPLWSSEPNQIPVYHTGSKRLGESQPCNLHYLFAYVRDWQPELGQCFIHKRRRYSREEGARRRIGVQLPTCRPHKAAGRHHPRAAPRFLQHHTAWRAMSSIEPGRVCCMQNIKPGVELLPLNKTSASRGCFNRLLATKTVLHCSQLPLAHLCPAVPWDGAETAISQRQQHRQPLFRNSFLADVLKMMILSAGITRQRRKCFGNGEREAQQN